MPRVIVITDQAAPGNAPVLFDERVNSVHLSTDHSALQFIERLGWAISDAEDAERVKVRRPAGTGASGRRVGSLRGGSRARTPVAFATGRAPRQPTATAAR
jgi:hypothetical protein